MREASPFQPGPMAGIPPASVSIKQPLFLKFYRLQDKKLIPQEENNQN